METKRWPLIGITSLIPTLTAILPDFGLFYVFIRVSTAITENRDSSLFPVCLILLILCGLLFPAAERITSRIVRKAGTLGKKERYIALLIGEVVYVLAMAFLFPKSMDILYVYLSKSELGPGLSLLFFQLFSCAGAILCGVVNVIGLCTAKE